MKKALSIIGMFICSLFIFAACGIEGSTSVSGVSFVQDIFYVDYGVETKLEYKVLPSTASGYYASLAIVGGDEVAWERYYTLTEGKILVNRPSRKEEEDRLNKLFSLVFRVQIGDFSDTCEIRIKQYPLGVAFAKSKDTIIGGTVYQLDLNGTFEDQTRSLKEGEYNYKLTSSDESVILIEDQSDLRVRSTGRKGSATISLQICNSNNEPMEGLTSSIMLDVEPAAEDVFANLGDKFVLRDGGTYTISGAINQSYELQVRYFDEESMLIPLSGLDVSVVGKSSNGEDVLELYTEGGKTYIRILNQGTATLTIESKSVNSSGNPLKIVCKIVVA